MIQQPDLGKKIADLRKAKGLTQEELVEKCNLNVRTLQRIESGEVTPRTYTIRLIFEALEYSFDKSDEKGLIIKWLEQFYISFIDLFNLKTNTMKKISILTVSAALIVLAITTVNSEIKAQNNDKPKKTTKKREYAYKTNRGMVFSNFHCAECFEENDILIGRDVEFEHNGIRVKVGLISINQQSREFNAGFVKGRFSEMLVEATIEKGLFNDGIIEYSADKVTKSDSTILLEGNAKLIYGKNEGFIETGEIELKIE